MHVLRSGLQLGLHVPLPSPRWACRRRAVDLLVEELASVILRMREATAGWGEWRPLLSMAVRHCLSFSFCTEMGVLHPYLCLARCTLPAKQGVSVSLSVCVSRYDGTPPMAGLHGAIYSWGVCSVSVSA